MRKYLLLAILLTFSITAAAQGANKTGYVSWHPDGTMIAVAYDTAVEVIDVESLEVLNRFDSIRVVAEPAWSPDGDYLAFADGTDVEVWDQPWSPATANQIADYKYYSPDLTPGQLVPINAIAWSPDGSKIASVSGTRIEIWSVSTASLILRLPVEDIVWDIVPDLVWSSDNRIAIANISGLVLTLNPETGEIISSFQTPSFEESPPVFAVDFSPDGDQLVLASRIIQIWGDTRPAIFTEIGSVVYGGHQTPVNTVDWSPLGQYIASGSDDGQIRVWDAATATDELVIDLGSNVAVKSVAWSPDGSKLAYTDPQGKLQIIAVVETELTPTP